MTEREKEEFLRLIGMSIPKKDSETPTDIPDIFKDLFGTDNPFGFEKKG